MNGFVCGLIVGFIVGINIVMILAVLYHDRKNRKQVRSK